MFKEKEGGSAIDVQGIPCQLAMPGRIYDPINGKWLTVEIERRSKVFADCYWERDWRWSELANWERAEAEMQRPVIEQNKRLEKEGKEPLRLPAHSELNRFRKEMWEKRLGGHWFYNKNVVTYITGQHWFYLSVYHLDTGLPDYREADRLAFYFWQYCLEDPECFGMVEVTQRRAGKTYRAGSIALEMATRTEQFKAGIQSKNDPDAKKVFQKAIISPYRKYPKFFRPKDNMTQGKATASELKFTSGSAIFDDDELESWIDFRPSGKGAYDGQKLGFYLADEVGKTPLVDIVDRWLTVQPCLLDSSRRIIGKTIHTTTVEDMESGGKPFTKLWKDSNHREKGDRKRTASGLYRYFTAADNFGESEDKYGFVDKEKERAIILKNREGLDDRAKSQDQRRYPLDEREAFSIDASRCRYNPISLNNRRSDLEGYPAMYETGNLVWKDGIEDSEVVFIPNPKGRFLIKWHPPEPMRNVKKIRGNKFYPGCPGQGGGGCDPYDHKELSDGAQYSMSMGAIVIIKKPDMLAPTELDGGPVLIYAYRPDSPREMWEDAIKAAVYYGVQILIETNKPGCDEHFKERGYGAYSYQVPGKPKTGLTATAQSKGGGVPGQITDVTEQFIFDSLDTVWFPQLIDQWLAWDPAETTKYDLAVAFGYAEMLVKKTLFVENKRKNKAVLPVSDYMNFYRRKRRTIY